MNTLNSANMVGQKDPMTWVRVGCGGTKYVGKQDARRVASLYPEARLMDVAGDFTNFNQAGGIPLATARFLAGHPRLPNGTVLVMIEADHIFLQKLRLDALEPPKGIPVSWRPIQRHGGAIVGGDIAAAGHYLCCNDIGPPYMLSVQAWRKFTPEWNKEFQTGGWGADQVAFGKAGQTMGIYFNVFDNLMVSSYPDTVPAGWELVKNAIKELAGNVCATKEFIRKTASELPIFMHVVRPWISGNWGYSKYQVPPGWGMQTNTDGILECGMPLFADPPASLIQTASDDGSQLLQLAAVEAGSASLLQTSSVEDDSVNGWVVCTIVQSLNSMLINYKRTECPNGFNEARALKMNVPLSWTNSLIVDAVSTAPHGTDLRWMQACATGPRCWL